MRPSGRAPDQMRTISITPHYTRHAEGSCLIAFGDTKPLVPTAAMGTNGRRRDIDRPCRKLNRRDIADVWQIKRVHKAEWTKVKARA